MMCETLGVSRSGFYEWLHSHPSKRMLETQMLCEKIKELFEESEQTYGSRRIRLELKKIGYMISCRRVGKLMKLLGLYCKTKKKFRVTTDSNHKLPVAPNLLQRDFSATNPNEKYVGDITYIWTTEGWLYLAVVIDLFSRKVVGWSMQSHMQTSLV